MHRSSLTGKNHLISLKMIRTIASYLAARINIKRLQQKRKKSKIFFFLLSLFFIMFYNLNSISIVTASSANRNIIPKEQSSFIRTGAEISVNGGKFPVPWNQWYRGNSLHTAIGDTGAMRFLGLELSNTDDPSIQPIKWFSSQKISAAFNNPYRYLDITELAKKHNWKLQIQDNILIINSPPAKIKNIRTEKKIDRKKITIFLDRPTFWQVFQNKQEAIVNIDATTEIESSDIGDKFDLETSQKQTLLRLDLPENKAVRVSTFNIPDRIVIEFRTDAMIKRDIQWTNNLRWRSDYIHLNNSFFSRKKLREDVKSFPVVWLEIEAQANGIEILPIPSNKEGMNGTLRVVKTARERQATAAINGGFFNRNNELPLGAIRSQGQWLSGPILNRGAIAWDERNHLKIGRLRLEETLITTKGDRLPIQLLNSAYIQQGMARYTKEWGEFYTPLSDGEIIIIVHDDRIIRKLAGGEALKTKFSIPKNGYILTLRKDEFLSKKMTEGMKVHLNSYTVPREFGDYTEIIGAGPILLQNGKNVLNISSEKFSKFFGKQAAIRSAIAVTKEGKIAIVVVGKPAGKKGATLSELAEILQQLGSVDALNLDGGSSSSLYLGGQLINPSLIPVARVHNSIGIFLNK